MLQKNFTERQLLVLEIIVALAFCLVPLTFNNPYRINIFLSWEGAYRLYLGQVPFRDFSLPMGYAYWVIPAMFFKIFGPYFASLIKAQAFVNLISILAFRGILKTLHVRPAVIFLSVVVFCFSYVSFNFWPWYNHMVFVFEMVAIYFLLRAILVNKGWKVWINIAFAAFFIFVSIFTKQDAGGIGLMIMLAALTYDAWLERSVKKWASFAGFFLVFAVIFVGPLLQYDFLYWFNYGQAPHESRLVLTDFLDEILGWAYWEKFFLFILVVFVMDKALAGRTFLENKREVLFAWLTLAMLLQAMVIPVTSPVPEKNEVFFYAFGFAYGVANLRLNVNLSRIPYLITCTMLVVFWWTGIYWRNVSRLLTKKPPVVNKNEEKAGHHYRLAHEYKSMEHLFLAEETLEGIEKIRNLDIVRNTDPKDLRVLNMSELTSLAYELGFTPLTDQPMWFHQTVSIFEKEVAEFCSRVERHEYDLVIFESVSPEEVINFFPEGVHDCLKTHYQYEFTFLAPRHPEESYIHVFTRPKETMHQAAR